MASQTIAAFRNTRIAPTPSGYLHMGNAFSFLITQALAQRTGAAILLRIDDMDRGRCRPEYVEDIFETLLFLNIPYRQGPGNAVEFEKDWSQIHRMQLYEKALQTLRDADAVFACACTRTGGTHQACTCLSKSISLDAAAAWRLKTVSNEAAAVLDLYGRAVTATLPEPMQRFIVRRKDGLPAYQLTSVVDDLHFGIDLIVRGRDLWDSTVAQHVLAQRLGVHAFSKIRFCHHPLLLDAAGHKLSKSAGAASVRHWRSGGKRFDDLLLQISRLLHCRLPVRDVADLLKCLNF